MLSLIYLLILSSNVLAGVPSVEDRNTIIECHTKLREEVKPPASNMLLMSYSTALEKLAKDLIYYCNYGYPENYTFEKDVGIIEMDFIDRAPQYSDLCKINTSVTSYANEDCLKDCFIYLHMINSATTEVGCASGLCYKKASPLHRPEYLVCAYKPMKALTSDSKPYEPGISCEKCPKGYGCYRNQCRKKVFIIQHLQSPKCIAQ
uniref:SCP domain-containing protein n=1 Tax=Mesocestoides corti TaxID=53468 RepID=A0A5K3F0Z6_MESCO